MSLPKIPSKTKVKQHKTQQVISTADVFVRESIQNKICFVRTGRASRSLASVLHPSRHYITLHCITVLPSCAFLLHDQLHLLLPLHIPPLALSMRVSQAGRVSVVLESTFADCFSSTSNNDLHVPDCRILKKYFRGWTLVWCRRASFEHAAEVAVDCFSPNLSSRRTMMYCILSKIGCLLSCRTCIYRFCFWRW